MSESTVLAESDIDLLHAVLSPELVDNPYNFAMFMYPWGVEGGDLERFKGPRKWQRDEMLAIGEYLKEARISQILNGNAPDFFRSAVSSGRGPGKSALVGMLAHWFISTRIGGSVWIAANGEPQLRTKTFPEVAKWVARGLNSHWFELNAMSIQPKLWYRDLIEKPKEKGGLGKSAKYYYISGQLWSAENPEAFAGAHNWDGEMAVFDEANGIPDEIWDVQQGVFTEDIVDRLWLAYSNPRRNNGAFFECFHKNRDSWRTVKIDSRDVEGISLTALESIIKQHGIDSDQARVEVYGEFPLEGEDQFISAKLVEEAEKREWHIDPKAPVVIGVDPARGGADNTVITVRVGRNIKAIRRSHGDDTMVTCGKIIETIKQYEPDGVFIDEGGMGYGIVDRLREQGYPVTGVNFGWKANNKIMWGNKRSEAWGEMKEWLKTACIPKVPQLKDDLIGPRKKPDSSGAIFLEGKKEMKARGLASPDCFISGTLVMTPLGEVPIEHIKAGDLVTTPFGSSVVVLVHSHTVHELTKVEFSNSKCLDGKGSHKVFTFDSGWVTMDTLALTNACESFNLWSNLKWKYLERFFIRKSRFIFKQMVDTISLEGKARRRDYYIDASGLTTLGLFLKVIVFIIKMKIGQITRYLTLKSCQEETINQSIYPRIWQSRSSGRMQYKHYETQAIRPQSGMDQKKVENGIRRMVKNVGLIINSELPNVPIAVKNLKHRFRQEQNIVAMLAKAVSHIGVTLKQVFVYFAGKKLSIISTRRASVVPVSVQQYSDDKGKEVFNLTLDYENVYYANKILVANCADSLACGFFFPVQHRREEYDIDEMDYDKKKKKLENPYAM